MATELKVDPEQVLQQLKAGAKSTRTMRSLDVIHATCKEQLERGSTDFSYETIGKFSEIQGGPKAQPIRNAGGAVYRTLIDSWAHIARSKICKSGEQKNGGLDNDLLAMISDPVTKILVQSYISENKKLKYENQLLKMIAKEKVVINLNGKSKPDSDAVEVVMPIDFLLEQELDALRNAVSPELMAKMGWILNEQSGAISKGPLQVFKPGFVTAINKLMENLC